MPIRSLLPCRLPATGLFGPLTSRAAGAPVNSSSTVSESNELVLLDAHQVRKNETVLLI